MISLIILFLILAFNELIAYCAIRVPPPSGIPTNNLTAVVYPNFLGISLELSFVNDYFGNSSNEVPTAMVNYLTAIRNRTLDLPFRLRVGGNSMDSSTYVPNQQNIIEFIGPSSNADDQAVKYGRTLFDVLNTLSDKTGGAEYLIGLSLREPNSSNIALLASDAAKALGDKLDAFLLGNEPDLYSQHGERPQLANYTTKNYIQDYWTVFSNLVKTRAGDVLRMNKIAGPTICCFWDLNAIWKSGWLSTFHDRIKYITLQHYPQNNCFRSRDHNLNYYLRHAETVKLGRWQSAGIRNLSSMPPEIRKPLLMDEFSTAACGGLPGISDTFGATLWTVDYALQMATVGYSAAYLHTRERGITYNLFDPPNGSGAWTTNPTFYSYFPVSEALQAADGTKVVDLNIANSMRNKTATVAGYAIYDVASSNIHRVVLFNYANKSVTPISFVLDRTFFSPSSTSVLVRYLTAPHVNEKTRISWGSLTFAGVGDGNAVEATFGSAKDDQAVDCSQGCSIDVPGPALAVVYIGGPPSLNSQTINVGQATNTTSTASPAIPTSSLSPEHSAALLDLRLPRCTIPFVFLFLVLLLTLIL